MPVGLIDFWRLKAILIKCKNRGFQAETKSSTRTSRHLRSNMYETSCSCQVVKVSPFRFFTRSLFWKTRRDFLAALFSSSTWIFLSDGENILRVSLWWIDYLHCFWHVQLHWRRHFTNKCREWTHTTPEHYSRLLFFWRESSGFWLQSLQASYCMLQALGFRPPLQGTGLVFKLMASKFRVQSSGSNVQGFMY